MDSLTLTLRRSRYVQIHAGDEVLTPPFDASALDSRCLYAQSAITKGQRYKVSPTDLLTVMTLHEDDWTTIPITSQPQADTYGRLCQLGLLVLRDVDTEPYKTLRNNEDALRATGWGVAAALYAVSTEDYHLPTPTGEPTLVYDDVCAKSPEAFRKLRDRRPSPPTFHTRGDVGSANLLPLVEGQGQLYDTLNSRRSQRFFDTATKLTLEQFSFLLHHTFGITGISSSTNESLIYSQNGDGFYHLEDDGTAIVRRRYPSGGCRSVIEVYPLVNRVEGMTPGLHWYDAQAHATRLIRPIDSDERQKTIYSLLSGQDYASDAAAVLLLTVRVDRAMWKYFGINRAYLVMAKEVGAALMTCSLVAADQRLACTYTGAINSHVADDFLRIDGMSEKLMGAVSIGRPDYARNLPRLATIMPHQPVRDELPAFGATRS